MDALPVWDDYKDEDDSAVVYQLVDIIDFVMLYVTLIQDQPRNYRMHLLQFWYVHLLIWFCTVLRVSLLNVPPLDV